MGKEGVHGSVAVRDGIYSKRTLEKTFPELIPFLGKGARVLDVGCGPGNITIGIADIVKPGAVVGIEPEEKSVFQALETAERQNCTNVSFKVGDGQNLDYDDNSFDISCSHQVLQWTQDPLASVKEQKRVTVKDGWVIARVGYWDSSVFYPPRPVFSKISEILENYYEETPGVFLHHGNAGLRALEWFTKAGLYDIKIGIDAGESHFGSDDFEKTIKRQKLRIDPNGPARVYYDRLFSAGLLKNDDLLEAEKELEEWAKVSYAIRVYSTVLAVGKA